MRIIFLLIITFVAVGFNVRAQAPTPTPDDEPEFIVPARPTVSNPAEFQRPGVLQLEIGYDANFDSRGNYKDQQDMLLALRFAVNRHLLIELDTDSPYTLKDPSGIRQTGAGDTQLGIQGLLLPEKKSGPGIAIAYYVKFPTADHDRGLGTGRVDQSFIGLVSKTAGKTTVDFNAIYLLAGKTSGKGYASSGQGAFAVTQKLTKKFSLQGEISGMSRNDEQAGMMFGLGVASYQINSCTAIDGGIRFGLTPYAPRVGVVAGVTIGIASLYKKHH